RSAHKIRSRECLEIFRTSIFFPLLLTSCPLRIFCLPLCRGSSPVERGPEKAGVGSSTLPPGTIVSANKIASPGVSEARLRSQSLRSPQSTHPRNPLAAFLTSSGHGSRVLRDSERFFASPRRELSVRAL